MYPHMSCLYDLSVVKKMFCSVLFRNGVKSEKSRLYDISSFSNYSIEAICQCCSEKSYDHACIFL